MTPELAYRYDETVGRVHRRSHGQYFTPDAIAEFMCKWVVASGSKRVFDPAFGLGAFYFAARQLNRRIHFFGIDRDPAIISYFHQHTRETPRLSLLQQDYLKIWGESHDAIVCNPPYMRFQHFKDRVQVRPRFEQHLGLRLPGYINTASVFLLKSLSELTDGGRLAYIMPLEFLNTGYGSVVKQALLKDGMLKSLIRLQSEQDIFPDVITSVGIILVSKEQQRNYVEFATVNSLVDLAEYHRCVQNKVPISSIDPREKWMHYFESQRSTFDHDNLVPLRQYGEFRRGIATGANEFFALSLQRARQLKIPKSNLVPCITKSSHLTDLVFTDDQFQDLVQSGANTFLLDAKNRSHQAVSAYIKHGEIKEYHRRYLTKMRNPWFRIERREPSPILFGVFFRDRFKVVRNTSAALSLTCFHCFYPNLIGMARCDALFLYFLSRAARVILSRHLRRYGDGLNKFEPNDLNEALVPSAEWLSRLSDSDIRKAVKECSVYSKLPDPLDREFDLLLSTS
jgi:adenine-specific DNA-methyltransferase